MFFDDRLLTRCRVHLPVAWVLWSEYVRACVFFFYFASNVVFPAKIPIKAVCESHPKTTQPRHACPSPAKTLRGNARASPQLRPSRHVPRCPRMPLRCCGRLSRLQTRRPTLCPRITSGSCCWCRRRCARCCRRRACRRACRFVAFRRSLVMCACTRCARCCRRRACRRACACTHAQVPRLSPTLNPTDSPAWPRADFGDGVCREHCARPQEPQPTLHHHRVLL